MSTIRLSADLTSWASDADEQSWQTMQALGYTGLELPPERVFPEETYAHLTGATLFTGYLYQSFGLQVAALRPSLPNLRGVPAPVAAQLLEESIESVCRFAAACRCNTLVLPCETVPDETFLNRCGVLAARYQCTLALEPRGDVSTLLLCRLLKMLGIPGLAVSLHTGVLLAQGESVSALVEYLPLISHVRLCEPDGGVLQAQGLYRELALLLTGLGYQGWVSVQMQPDTPDQLKQSLEYAASLFA